jgi:hypothetical protein
MILFSVLALHGDGSGKSLDRTFFLLVEIH